MQSQKIAIIGGGPSGLTALKSALEDGLAAVLFEQSTSTGGQWNQQSDNSGVWDNLHTNSSRYMTLFSDFLYQKKPALHPGHKEIFQYLDDYKKRFGLARHIRVNARVVKIDRIDDGSYEVRYITGEKSEAKEIFTHVIIATGRFNKPHFPQYPGIDIFEGKKIHAFHYKRNSDFSGKRVLVVGDRVSGLEIASDLSTNESINVISSSRKPKYILKLVIDQVPGDHLLFTRFSALAARAFPPHVNAARLKAFVLKSCGNPSDYGGLKPAENIFEAGISASDHYLEQLQMKKILAKGPIKCFTAQSVIFEDGSKMKIDAVIFSTGYDINLPFLSKEIAALIKADEPQLALYKHTFHPDLPNMAFVGLFAQIGPKFPSFELQSRWITGTWSGNIPAVNPEEMREWISQYEITRKKNMTSMSQEMILTFAKAAAVEPELDRFPDLAGALIFGPMVPSQFRLQGHGKLSNAKEIFLANNAYEVNDVRKLNADQLEQLKTVAANLKEDHALQKLLEAL